MVRNIQIYLDNPFATYYPGDTVTGKVVVRTDKEEKIRYISTTFRGEAHVQWTVQIVERTPNGQHITRNVTFAAHEHYFEMKYYFVGGPSQELKLPPGQHVYNFSVKLPENLPSSFEGEFGCIRYTIEAKMNRPWASDEKCRALYSVISHLDLNKDPLVKEPVSQAKEKTLCCCCCKSGPLTVVANLPATGFVSGQEIPVTVEVDNGTNETISSVTCNLGKNVHFTALSPGKKTIKIGEKVETITYEPVGPKASKTWTKSLKIPSLPPSSLNHCSIIDLDYFLHVKAVVSGLHKNIDIIIPIKLGTIPLLSYIPPALYPPPYSVMPPSTDQLGITNGQPNQLNTVPSEPHIPYPEVPPPSYEECVYGGSNINYEEDTSHSQDENKFLPRYPTYNLNFEKSS